MVYYGYEKFVEDVKKLVRMTQEYNPDAIIGIARGSGKLLICKFFYPANGFNTFISSSYPR